MSDMQKKHCGLIIAGIGMMGAATAWQASKTKDQLLHHRLDAPTLGAPGYRARRGCFARSD